MVKFTNYVNTKYNNKNYTVIKIPYKKYIVPIVLDTFIFDKIKYYNNNWNILNNGNIYTIINNNILYLHEIVYILHNNNKNKYSLIHLNKIGLDNRIDNIIEDKTNKSIRKNLNKKSRIIKLKNIDVNNIPSFVWYLKKNDTHGERFQVELGNIRWKSCSSNKLSLNYKLEETKKFLRQYKDRNKNNKNFLENSMNSDLNIHGINSKRNFYNILKTVNMNYEYNINNNTNELLKEDLSKLNDIEKELLKQFDINNNLTTFDRMKILIH